MGPRAGVTLLEVLVVLAILALSAAVAFSSLRPPSDALTLSKRVAELEKDFALDRLRAIREGRAIIRDVEALACEQDTNTEVIFRSDGTALGPDLCLSEGKITSRFALDPLTGRLSEAKP
jgi:prepilin-type N-terminal cleavage/methylation domain-containing protein